MAGSNKIWNWRQPHVLRGRIPLRVERQARAAQVSRRSLIFILFLFYFSVCPLIWEYRHFFGLGVAIRFKVRKHCVMPYSEYWCAIFDLWSPPLLRYECIPKSWLCDGDVTCAGGEDENSELCKVYFIFKIIIYCSKIAEEYNSNVIASYSNYESLEIKDQRSKISAGRQEGVQQGRVPLRQFPLYPFELGVRRGQWLPGRIGWARQLQWVHFCLSRTVQLRYGYGIKDFFSLISIRKDNEHGNCSGNLVLICVLDMLHAGYLWPTIFRIAMEIQLPLQKKYLNIWI